MKKVCYFFQKDKCKHQNNAKLCRCAHIRLPKEEIEWYAPPMKRSPSDSSRGSKGGGKGKPKKSDVPFVRHCHAYIKGTCPHQNEPLDKDGKVKSGKCQFPHLTEKQLAEARKQKLAAKGKGKSSTPRDNGDGTGK